jgi:hypothetical protein
LSSKEDNLIENKEIVKKEISVYQDRINQIDKWRPIIDSNLINCLPSIPLSYEPSPRGLEAIRVSLYVLNSAPIVLEFSKAFVFLWRKHLFNALSLPARQIFEMWGAAHYSCQLLNGIDDPDKIGIISIKINNLMLGARSEVELPWGGLTKEKSTNVMDFIRSLKDVHPKAEETYGFLCESCHPSFIRQMQWSLAGPRISNWRNQNFNRIGHVLIDRTILAVETALNGYALDVKRTLEYAKPYISAEA